MNIERQQRQLERIRQHCNRLKKTIARMDEDDATILETYRYLDDAATIILEALEYVDEDDVNEAVDYIEDAFDSLVYSKNGDVLEDAIDSIIDQAKLHKHYC